MSTKSLTDQSIPQRNPALILPSISTLILQNIPPPLILPIIPPSIPQSIPTSSR